MTLTLGIYLFVVQFFAFIIKGLVGFGNPLLSGPMLAMKLDNRVITPGNLLLDLPVNTYIVVKNRHSFDVKTALPVAFWIILGVIPGTLFLKMSSPWLIKALLGVFIIGLGIEMATRDRAKAIKPSKVARAVISLISGVMGALFGINLLFLAYMERVAVDRQQFRTNVCFVFLIENAFRTIVYAWNGMFTAMTFSIAAISVPAAILGIYVGGKIDKKIDEKLAKRLVIGVFIMGGVSILVKALIFRA